MKTGIYWQDPKYALKPGRDFIRDPSLVLDLPLYKLDGASFMSRDAYGHLCVVTGALWRPQGRDFDGNDDYIDCGGGIGLPIGNSDRTIELWVKPDTLANWTGFFLYGTLAAGGAILFYTGSDGDRLLLGRHGLSVTSSLVLTTGVFQHIVATVSAGDQVNFSLDGQHAGPYTLSGIDTTLNVTYIGMGGGACDDPNMDGLIGEVRIYSRALTPLEIQHNYLATKWRYQ